MLTNYLLWSIHNLAFSTTLSLPRTDTLTGDQCFQILGKAKVSNLLGMQTLGSLFKLTMSSYLNYLIKLPLTYLHVFFI